MHYVLEEIDSAVLGEPVVSLRYETGTTDVAAVEAECVREHDPAYASCSVPLQDVALLHALQKQGFLFIECQLKTIGEPRHAFDTSAYPYRYERITSRESLEDVLAIAGAVIRYDRFSIDPDIPRWYSGARYEAYVRQSFESDTDEVWQLCDTRTGRAAAFRTFRSLADASVRLLLEGVGPLQPSVGVGAIETQFFLSEMCRRGVPSLVGHVSAINLTGFALDITAFGFRLTQAFAVLRKIYKPIATRPKPSAITPHLA